ncbi:hypothetical protein Bca52824_023386 [Brassica carinata]|uniref:RNase H type-1 domain-containing protein n=1 Tax=Brassica carinata TaxID=52824 RepID=A0A8X8ASJ4_BRACI|nr:hypothetical protein Bca52824_023386 [Brassica carinata]
MDTIVPSAPDIVCKTGEEASIWLNLHGCLQKNHHVSLIAPGSNVQWTEPFSYVLKCNISSYWSASSTYCGGSWIIRNSTGKVLLHSRGSFYGVSFSVQAELLALSWAASAVKDHKLKNVCFKFSSPGAADALTHPPVYPFSYSTCHEVLRNIYALPKSAIWLVPRSCNLAASAIAESVISGQRFQSYVAFGGPRWLAHWLDKEAASP